MDVRCKTTALLGLLAACACATGYDESRGSGSTSASVGVAYGPDVNPVDMASVPGCWSLSTRYAGAQPDGNQKLSGNFKGPLRTTQWWASAAWDYPTTGDPVGGKPFSEPLYAQPLTVASGPHGLWMSYIDADTITADNTAYYYAMSPTPDLIVGAANLAATGSSVDAASDWSVRLVWTGANTSLRATVVKGSPYVYVDGLESQALVQLTGASPSVFANLGDTIGVTMGNASYGIFAPPGCAWTADATGTQFASKLCGKTYYAVAALPDASPDTLTFFRQHAFAFVTDTVVTWDYNQTSGIVTTTYTDTVDVKEASLSTEPLMSLFAHHYKHSSAPVSSYTFSSPRGPLKVLADHSFQTQLTFHGVLPALPNVAALDPNAVNTYLQDVVLSPDAISMADTYTSGVAMNRLAQWVPIAAEVGNANVAAQSLALVQNALTDWFSADHDTPPLFEYHPMWSSIVGYPASYGSDTQLNDHHFHWGYHISAAALVALYDPPWGQDTGYGGMVKQMVRDAENPLRNDRAYPFLRHFDVYEGHSWASGHANFATGNDQESSSEAMNFAYALVYWGEVSQNKTIRDLGVYLYVTEADAIAQYYFDADGSNFPSDTPQADYTLLWGAGAAYATWWTSQPEALHGIEFLPFTGGSFYLGDNPNALSANYAAMTKQLGGSEGSQSNPDAWVDIIWNMQAMYDPNNALAKFNASATTYAPQAGETRLHTYQWLSNMAALGQVNTAISADDTLAVVFTKAGVNTYVAFNTFCDHPRTVKYTDGTAVIVPPHTLLASRNGNIIAQTLIGSSGCTAPPLGCAIVDTGLGAVQ